MHNCSGYPALPNTAKLAIVLHMEGAEALQHNPDLLDVFYDAGLRSIGPLWNRPSRFDMV